nr:uncharacterized protein LOC109180246 [Ipomoea trifida]
MSHADMQARTVVDKWLEGEVGKQFLLDLGEGDYGLGYQDAQKEIFDQLKAWDTTFSPTRWGFLSPTTPIDDQGAEDAIVNASANTTGDEILMDNDYLNSSTNLNFVVWIDPDPVPTLAESGQGDTVVTEEEDPSAAFKLNRRCSRSSEHNLPTRPTEVDTNGVPQFEAKNDMDVFAFRCFLFAL